MVRLEQGNPPKENCSYGFCAGGVCGDTISLSPNSWLPYLYNVADLLGDVLKDNPTISTEAMRLEAQEYWKKSVVEEASRLKSQCVKEMSEHPTTWPTSAYGPSCYILTRALKEGVKRIKLGLSQEMEQKLLTAFLI